MALAIIAIDSSDLKVFSKFNALINASLSNSSVDLNRISSIFFKISVSLKLVSFFFSATRPVEGPAAVAAS